MALKVKCKSLIKVLEKTFLGLSLSLLLLSPSLADGLLNTNHSSNLIEYLSQERLNLNLGLMSLKAKPEPKDQVEYDKDFHEIKALLALNKAKIASLESFLINQRKHQADFSVQLKLLQQTPNSTSPQIAFQEKIEKVIALNNINNKSIEDLNENLSLAKLYRSLLIQKSHDLDLWKSKYDLDELLLVLHGKEEKLNNSLQKLFESSLKLQQEINTGSDFKAIYLVEARLLLNNQVINLTQHKIAELNLQRKLAKADYSLLKTPDIRTLQKVTDIYKAAISQLSDMEQSLKKMISMLKIEQRYLTDGNLKRQFSSLVDIISRQITAIGIQEQTLQEDLENHQQELKKQLSVRQNLSEFSLDGWPALFNQFTNIPEQFYNYLKSLSFKLRDNYLWQDTLPKTIFWLAVCFIFVGFFILKKLLNYLSQERERSRLSTVLYSGFLTLVSRNLPYLVGSCLLVVVLYLNQIPYANYQLLFYLILIWLTFRTLIIVARLGLMETVTDSSGKDVRLYYRIRWLLLVGGWTTGLMMFSNELPLSALLQDVFNRFFMLFLVAVSIVTWKSRDAITHLLNPLLQSKKRYIRNAIMLLVILAPLTLFAIAVIGLIGYINLAWTMSRYQVLILLIISAYVLTRGLLFDALELLSELMIRSLNNGWLWVEVVLKPLDKILRLILLGFSLFVLSKLFDWNTETTLFIKVKHYFDYPLVNIAGIYITGLSIIEFLILLSVFAWVSRWTKEFCFRWLYRDTTDVGIRNSLSVFTQYAVILIGGFVALRILGLDFSGMSMVIGGLAVGMGFGLRDFASNIVGGLMLLIERPVRVGDVINLGEYEGQVSHIGIRSMRVSSWDNMEILIPNAETFNKPFTNWTHQDNIVRTVIPIKVSRTDDPLMIQQLILDVLAIIPEIVNEPPVQVFLKEIDEALIEFEVRYFINVQNHTRFEIRSKVLFAIMEQFKFANIKPPIPPISVELKETSIETKKLAEY